METYGRAFASVYDRQWTGFARRVGPLLLDFHERQTAIDGSILDLCCGTGQFAVLALQRGYRVVGIDASEPMLEHARARAGAFIRSGQAHFRKADARTFTLDERFSLVVSMFDSLNHLQRAFVRISGFVRNPDDRYERFEEVIPNAVYDLDRVRCLLLDNGWESVHLARVDDLGQPLADPEAEERVFFVARKGGLGER